MLKGLRKNTKVIIWTVILSFALWGGFSVGIQFQKQGRLAGEIFGKGVSFQEYNRFYRAAEIFSFSGKPIEDPEVLKQNTWQNLVYDREAKRQKINVSDDETREEILKLLARQGVTDPTPDQYKRWVQATAHENPQDFEAQIREILRIQKLIRGVNDQPVAPAEEQQAHKLFLLKEHRFSALVASFENQTEALGFYEKAQKPNFWEKEMKKDPKKIQNIGMTSLENWMKTIGISEDAIFALDRLEKGTASKPFPVGNEFAVFRILEKTGPPEEKFEKELKQKYSEDLIRQKKYERFLQWHVDLMNRSHLKDYLPKAEEVNS